MRSMLTHASTLRAAGLSVTAQRLAIMRAVAAHPHATADDIHSAARDDIGSLSRQAAYDALHTLSDHDLIRRIQPNGSIARYESRVGDNHHHVVCRSCGTVRDVDCAVHHTPCLTASDDHGFIIDEAEVIYWGYCPECTANGASPTTHNTGVQR